MGCSHNAETIPFPTLHHSFCQHYWPLISPGGDSDFCAVERILSNKALGNIAHRVVYCYYDYQRHSRSQKARLNDECYMTVLMYSRSFS